MKKILSVLLVLLAFNSISIAQAQDDNYSATLETMFKVAGTEETYKSVILQMFDMFKQQYPDVDKAVWSDMQDEFIQTSLSDLVVMLAPIYKKYMTKADLEGVIAFYNSPVGKKFAKNTPLITQESMQVGQEWGMKIGEKFTKRMEKEGK